MLTQNENGLKALQCYIKNNKIYKLFIYLHAFKWCDPVDSTSAQTMQKAKHVTY